MGVDADSVSIEKQNYSSFSDLGFEIFNEMLILFLLFKNLKILGGKNHLASSSTSFKKSNITKNQVN